MKYPVLIAALLAALMLNTQAWADRSYSEQEDQNKRIVLDFYEKALNQKDFKAASQHLGAYVQHNPNVEDGAEGLQKFVAFLKEKYPEARYKVTQVLVDGDFVVLRVLGIREPGSKGNAIVDIFRVRDGKIVEHWDSVQPIPETAKNSNTMF